LKAEKGECIENIASNYVKKSSFEGIVEELFGN
jgi:hypothetical protein